MKNYMIEVMDSGMLLTGSVGLTEFPAIEKMAQALGFDLVDVGLAQALNATMVITNKAGSEKLREEVEKSNAGKSAIDAWISGCDTGISSKTIFFVMTGKPFTGSFRPDVPHDPDDFGRCYRLLQKIPEWKTRMAEVSGKYPEWAGLVEHWDELTEMYEREEWKQMYNRMQELRSLKISARSQRKCFLQSTAKNETNLPTSLTMKPTGKNALR